MKIQGIEGTTIELELLNGNTLIIEVKKEKDNNLEINTNITCKYGNLGVIPIEHNSINLITLNKNTIPKVKCDLVKESWLTENYKTNYVTKTFKGCVEYGACNYCKELKEMEDK